MPMLQAHLAERSLLLLLDNLEQIANAGEIVDQLMSASPGLRVLATSQRPLGLYGEHEYPVPPLRVPEASATPPLDHILEYEAVALFVARARATKPQFRVDERNAAFSEEVFKEFRGSYSQFKAVLTENCATFSGLSIESKARFIQMMVQVVVGRVTHGSPDADIEQVTMHQA